MNFYVCLYKCILVYMYLRILCMFMLVYNVYMYVLCIYACLYACLCMWLFVQSP